MGLTSWLLYGGAAAAALALATYIYRRRESPGRGRPLLASLRWLTLALLLLLLFDPEVPVPGIAAGAARGRVLLDASLSMLLPAGAGDETRWERAIALARQRANGRDVLLFGAAPRALPVDSLAAYRPASPESRLLPALRAAAEAGVRRVTIITDGGIQDAAEVTRALPDLGISVSVVRVSDGAVSNRGLLEVEAPGWAAEGDTIEVHAGIGAFGGAGDSVTLVVERDGQALGETTVELPEPGRIARATVRFPAPAAEGGAPVRLDLRLTPGDAVADDDWRSGYVHVSEDPPGVALVSFRPDWEPRFLVPVLEQSLGLPVRGFLRADASRYIRVGVGEAAGARQTEQDARRAVERADLVVLHGLAEDAPGWAREAARTARRVLIFPAGDARDVGAPIELAPPASGEWYPVAEVPASPVAALFGTLRFDLLPPLTGVRPADARAGAWAPLLAQRDRRGAQAPVALAGERDGRRWAVALGEGYWQWAFRGGDAGQVYRHLWSALAGWLVQEERAIALSPVRPAERTFERGRAVEFVAPGLSPDSVAVRMESEAGEPALDTTVAAIRGDTVAVAALPPGHYRYAAVAYANGEEVARSDGALTVEGFSAEFARPAMDLPDWQAAAGGPDARAARITVPLHTVPWVYLFLLAVLCTEWVLRRRWGLR